jgi:hypothetical protein
MNAEPNPRPLREIEMQVMAEGWEWTRQSLWQRLQKEAAPPWRRFPLWAEAK